MFGSIICVFVDLYDVEVLFVDLYDVEVLLKQGSLLSQRNCKVEVIKLICNHFSSATKNTPMQ